MKLILSTLRAKEIVTNSAINITSAIYTSDVSKVSLGLCAKITSVSAFRQKLPPRIINGQFNRSIIEAQKYSTSYVVNL